MLEMFLNISWEFGMMLLQFVLAPCEVSFFALRLSLFIKKKIPRVGLGVCRDE